MEVRELEAFLAVARELHFARAAATLSLTQPALSRRVQSLERELDVRLFDRDRRTVALTRAGQALVAPATSALEAMSRAAAAARAAVDGGIGRVRIAYAGTSTHVMMAELARLTAEREPGVTLELLSSNFALPALDKVLRGDVDVAFGRWSDVPAGVSSRVVAVESLVVALRSDHPAAAGTSVSMARLRQERWVTLPSTLGSVLINHLRRLAAAAGFVPEVAQEAPDTWTLVSLVEAGVGCSLTLSSVADNISNPRVVFLPLEEVTDPVELRVAWRADADNPALYRLLALTGAVLPTPPVDGGDRGAHSSVSASVILSSRILR